MYGFEINVEMEPTEVGDGWDVDGESHDFSCICIPLVIFAFTEKLSFSDLKERITIGIYRKKCTHGFKKYCVVLA